MQPVLLFQLLILIAVANGITVIAKKLFGPFAAWPLDGGVTLGDGQHLLGSSKTIRGVALSVLLTPIAAVCLAPMGCTTLRRFL